MQARRLSRLLLSLLVLAITAHGTWAQPRPEPDPPFEYDTADQQIAVSVLEQADWYDADLLVSGDQVWLTWLAFEPGRGDQIWVGSRRNGIWLDRQPLQLPIQAYAHPQLTYDAGGTLWLTYEAEETTPSVDNSEPSSERQWDVWAVPLDQLGLGAEPQRVSGGSGSDINHRTVADPVRGLWVTWQADRDGQFDILLRHVADQVSHDPIVVSDLARSDWCPALAIGKDNQVVVAWDCFDGESHNVVLRTLQRGRLQSLVQVAAGPEFEGRPTLASDPHGQIWLAWEQGGSHWGRPFRGINTELVQDNHGPLHRFRILHIAAVGSDGSVRRLAQSLPMPSLTRAARRLPIRPGVERLGAFYERARLTCDASGRLWVFYRHFYTPWLGTRHRSHVQSGWGIYARCLSGDGWSPLYRFETGQGDGMQSLAVAAGNDAVHAVWTVGRTHRSISSEPRGIVVAQIPASEPPVKLVERVPLQNPVPAVSNNAAARRPPPPKSRDQSRRLFFGDLHRHTDLSLCRVPLDGTIEDAYRYAIDVAEMDFLGITDHSRDLAQGDANSQLWWHNRKEVYRHQLSGNFVPLVAYERSHSNTADHNVISLRDDMLRPFTYPVPEFWKELDADTFTIPHQPIRRDTWNYQDDRLRPLVEIFQGCRDQSIEDQVHQALAKGYRMGFIASSDHMSTSASYAGVWADDASRASIFAALQARRTFAATAPIQLEVRSGPHWMGDVLPARDLTSLSLVARGTRAIRQVQIVVNGQVQQSFSPNQIVVRKDVELAMDGSSYVRPPGASGRQPSLVVADLDGIVSLGKMAGHPGNHQQSPRFSTTSDLPAGAFAGRFRLLRGIHPGRNSEKRLLLRGCSN